MTVIATSLVYTLRCDECQTGGGGAPWEDREPRRSGSDLQPVPCRHCQKGTMRWSLRLLLVVRPPIRVATRRGAGHFDPPDRRDLLP